MNEERQEVGQKMKGREVENEAEKQETKDDGREVGE